MGFAKPLRLASLEGVRSLYQFRPSKVEACLGENIRASEMAAIRTILGAVAVRSLETAEAEIRQGEQMVRVRAARLQSV